MDVVYHVLTIIVAYINRPGTSSMLEMVSEQSSCVLPPRMLPTQAHSLPFFSLGSEPSPSVATSDSARSVLIEIGKEEHVRGPVSRRTQLTNQHNTLRSCRFEK